MAFVGSLGTNQTEEASGGVFVEPESSLDWKGRLFIDAFGLDFESLHAFPPADLAGSRFDDRCLPTVAISSQFFGFRADCSEALRLAPDLC